MGFSRQSHHEDGKQRSFDTAAARQRRPDNAGEKRAGWEPKIHLRQGLLKPIDAFLSEERSGADGVGSQ
jgi:hypothetical protein